MKKLTFLLIALVFSACASKKDSTVNESRKARQAYESDMIVISPLNFDKYYIVDANNDMYSIKEILDMAEERQSPFRTPL